MDLYIVKNQYRYHADSHISYLQPILWTITVLKETAKNYLVECEEATGYHSRIAKDDVRYATSGADAWDIYINRVKQALLSMKKERIENNEALIYAKDQRRAFNG